jgi:hypothetical protein
MVEQKMQDAEQKLNKKCKMAEQKNAYISLLLFDSSSNTAGWVWRIIILLGLI